MNPFNSGLKWTIMFSSFLLVTVGNQWQNLSPTDTTCNNGSYFGYFCNRCFCGSDGNGLCNRYTGECLNETAGCQQGRIVSRWGPGCSLHGEHYYDNENGVFYSGQMNYAVDSSGSPIYCSSWPSFDFEKNNAKLYNKTRDLNTSFCRQLLTENNDIFYSEFKSEFLRCPSDDGNLLSCSRYALKSVCPPGRVGVNCRYESHCNETYRQPNILSQCDDLCADQRWNASQKESLYISAKYRWKIDCSCCQRDGQKFCGAICACQKRCNGPKQFCDLGSGQCFTFSNENITIVSRGNRSLTVSLDVPQVLSGTNGVQLRYTLKNLDNLDTDETHLADGDLNELTQNSSRNNFTELVPSSMYGIIVSLNLMIFDKKFTLSKRTRTCMETWRHSGPQLNEIEDGNCSESSNNTVTACIHTFSFRLLSPAESGCESVDEYRILVKDSQEDLILDERVFAKNESLPTRFRRNPSQLIVSERENGRVVIKVQLFYADKNDFYSVRLIAINNAGQQIYSEIKSFSPPVVAPTAQPIAADFTLTLILVALALTVVLIILIICCVIVQRRSRRNQTQLIVKSEETDEPLESTVFIDYSKPVAQVVASKRDGSNRTGSATSREANGSVQNARLATEYYNLAVVNLKTTSIAVDALKETILAKITNNEFKREFNRLPALDQSKATVACQPRNTKRNRYRNTIAYDAHRVKVPPLHLDRSSVIRSMHEDDEYANEPMSDDYINASWIDGYELETRYIASQAPKPMEFERFWRMCWMRGVTRIVVLSNTVEGGRQKVDPYWPEELGESAVYGNDDFKVTLLNCKDFGDFIERKLRLKNVNDGNEMDIVHLQLTCWPDHAVIDTPSRLTRFWHMVLDGQLSKNGNLVLIHCSAGVGRTGTILGFEFLSREAQVRANIDVFSYVTLLRERRPIMVQTLDQYVFLHQTIYHELTFGDTRISDEDLRLIGADEKQRRQLFERLQLAFPPIICSRSMVSADPSNYVWPPTVSRVPFDSTEPGIEAAYLSSYSRLEAFILTRRPTDSQQVTNLLLTARRERCPLIVVTDAVVTSEADQVGSLDASEISSIKDTVSVVVDEETAASDNLESLVVTLHEQNDLEPTDGDLYSNMSVGKIRVVHSKAIANSGESSVQEYVAFAELVGQLADSGQSNSKVGPIMMVCDDAISTTAPLVTLLNLLEHRRLFDGWDLVDAVLRIRAVHRDAFRDFQQFSFLIDCLLASLNGNNNTFSDNGEVV